MRQSFHFLTDSAVRLEFHTVDDLSGLTLTTLYNPPREPDTATFATADEMADAMEERVKLHLEEYPARLTRIRFRFDPAPIEFTHLGRYGVPLLPDDTGQH